MLKAIISGRHATTAAIDGQIASHAARLFELLN